MFIDKVFSSDSLIKSLLVFLLLVSFQYVYGQNLNGFDIGNATIPSTHIKDGGPPKDGIPSIDKPEFIKASASKFKEDTRVLGVYVNGIAKAYPINIMNFHEIVNDDFNGKPIVVTYCPLCGSGMAFDATIDNEKRTFGVSGLLYNSDVLLYDRQSESLWSQIMMESISGKSAGKSLTMVPTMNTDWKEWVKKHPRTLVLTENTGYKRNYSVNPYPGYEQSAELYFTVENEDKRFHPKQMVIGIEVNGKFKAYPFSELEKIQKGVIKDFFEGQQLSIIYNPSSKSATISNNENKELPALTTFWFAWYAFHPETEVFEAKGN